MPPPIPFWVLRLVAWVGRVWRNRLGWEIAIVVVVLLILGFAVFVLPIVNLRHC